MSKSFAEIARHPARYGVIVLIAVAVAMLALFFARMDTQASHQAGLIELDYVVGNNGTCTATTALPNCDNANTFTGGTVNPGFDWESVCTVNSSGDITTRPASALALLPGNIDAAATFCQQDYKLPEHTYFDSGKDIQDFASSS